MARLRLVLVAFLAVGLVWWAAFSGPGGSGDATDAAPDDSTEAATTTRGDAWSGRRGTGSTADAGSAAHVFGAEGAPLEALHCDAPRGDVARVDGQGISAAEVCAEWKRLSGAVQKGDPVVMDRHGKQLLERMIDAVLVTRALVTDGLVISEADVDAAVDAAATRRARSDRSVDAMKAFEAELKATGSTIEQVRRELRERLALEALVAHREPFEPSDAVLQRAYAEDPTRFGAPRTAKVEGVLARAPESAAAHERQRALEIATAFSTRVASGESVEAAMGPGLQPMAPFEVTSTGAEPQLAAAAFHLSPGDWSPPVQTRAGVVVMQLVEIRGGEPRPFSEVREQVKQRVQGEHTLAARGRVLSALREAATIEYLQ